MHDASMSPDDVIVETDAYMALSKVTFAVAGRTLMGVAGPNGVGKSTLFDAISGPFPIHLGRVTLSYVERLRGRRPASPGGTTSAM